MATKRQVAGSITLLAAFFPNLPKKILEWFWELVRAKLGEALVKWLEEGFDQLSLVVDTEWLFRAVLLGVTVWLFWPQIRARTPFLGPKYELLDDAALTVYEADEERSEEISMAAAGAVSAQSKHDHFKYVLLTFDDVPLYGVKPPSRKLRAIPAEVRRQLHPTEKPNSLSSVVGREAQYVDVSVRRKDLPKIIKKYLAAARVMAVVERNRGGGSGKPPAAAKQVPEPNMRLEDVVKRITKLNDLPSSIEPRSALITQACDVLREKALLRQITVFGGIGWRTTPPADYDRMTRAEIPSDYWRDHRIDVIGFLGIEVGDIRGRTQDLAGNWGDPTNYYGIWFDREQIDALWPPSHKSEAGANHRGGDVTMIGGTIRGGDGGLGGDGGPATLKGGDGGGNR